MTAATAATFPFSLPARLPADLARARDYWESLKRGENELPFSDDVNLAQLPDLQGRLILLESFERPQRFRFNSVGDEAQRHYGVGLSGKFVDEVTPKPPIQFLAAQASATVEARQPTYVACAGNGADGRPLRYERVLLPFWGNGRIELVLVAIGRIEST